MKTTIGGDRLGSGGKNQVTTPHFNRSTFDLSYVWRNTMSIGTLVPFMSEVGLPGDKWDIKLNADAITLPTLGPLFGKFKYQMDVFSIPIRLYQGQLHMNKLGIGNHMENVKLPQIEMEAKGGVYNEEWDDNLQINSSSIFSYLNIRGLGVPSYEGENSIYCKRQFNAVPYLAYADIYKNYYANKQEEYGVIIHNNLGDGKYYSINTARIQQSSNADILAPEDHTFAIDANKETAVVTIKLQGTNGLPTLTGVNITIGTTTEPITDCFTYVEWNPVTKEITCNDYIGAETGNQTITINQQVIATNEENVEGKPNLYQFPLENIDTMREQILMAVQQESAYIIDKDSIEPYGLALNQKVDPEDPTNKLYSKNHTQEGLFVKTYQSDLFNNWISTEWIDGTNGINEITSVDTSDGAFTIDALNLASKVYAMLNGIAISGGTYDNWQEAVYDEKPFARAESPIYMGSLIKEINFQEVVSTAQTNVESEQKALGTLAGKGRIGAKHKGGIIKIDVKEPSYIIGICSLTPIVDYSQGNKWDTNLKTMNDFYKPQLGQIGFQDLLTDQMSWMDTECDYDGNIVFKSAGKQPAWINYMTNVNQVRGAFAEKNNQMFMVLNRRYENNGKYGVKDITTYIDPSKFNHVFADAELTAMNFWCQINLDIKARRKMSSKVIPNL